jgi:hypothetical protein
MANAHANTMNMTANVNRGTVIKTLVYLVALGAVALATSFARGEDQPPRATVNRAVQVKQVTGAAEYAYDSTGWRPLTAGKILHAGASIRTGNSATVVLAGAAGLVAGAFAMAAGEFVSVRTQREF